MNRGARHAALGSHVLRRDACVVDNDAENLAVEIVYLSHVFLEYDTTVFENPLLTLINSTRDGKSTKNILTAYILTQKTPPQCQNRHAGSIFMHNLRDILSFSAALLRPKEGGST